MSFDKMKVDELRQIADDFAVDIDAKDNKAVILAKLGESGVTWDYYQNSLGEAVEQPEPSQPTVKPSAASVEDRVLIRMTRANPTFEIRGARFTKDNPYALVAERDADFIVENYEGFRIASPREVKEFYS
jgi:hypothetical protein